jgi:CheY-like chemotaxis protein
MKKKHHILIIDDDADDREMVKDAFATTSDAYEYVFMENGDKVLEYLRQNTGNGLPSLIMIDLNMPGKDGRETLKEIKTDKRFLKIPTIIFTTSSSERDKMAAYDLGANCFITKPDTFQKLLELAKSITHLWLQ